MGRQARGVRGMNLEEGQRVIAMLVAEAEASEAESAPGARSSVLTATENGYGKRTPIADYTRKGKGGQGIIAIDTGERNGELVGAVLVSPTDDLMLITSGGVLIRTKVEQVRETGRAAAGVRLINLDEGTTLVSLERVAESEEDEAEAAEGEA